MMRNNRLFICILLLLTSFFVGCENNLQETKDKTIKDKNVKKEIVDSFRNSKKIYLKDFNGYPNDGKDDTKAFNDALAVSHTEKVTLVLDKGIYDTSENVEIFDSKGIKIIGNDAEIKPKNPMRNPPEFYALKIYGNKSNLIDVQIENLTVNGEKNPQDLYFTMKKPSDFYKTQMMKGIYIENSKNIILEDLNYKHMYGGYTIHLENYRNVEIDKIDIKDVGGDDITDSFGNMIYLGGHDDIAVVNINNVNAIGKRSVKNEEYMAWIGVVLENGTIQNEDTTKWLKDLDTTVNINNSKFENLETTFHIESTYGNVYWNVDDTYTKAKDYLIAAGINGELKERSNNIKFDMFPYGRNGQVTGVYYTDKMNEYVLNMYNSEINHIEDTKKKALVSLVYGNDTKATFHNSIFKGVPNLLVLNASVELNNSRVILDKKANKDKLFSYNKDNQFVKLNKTEISYDELKAPKKLEAPKKLKASSKKPPEMKKPAGHIEIEEK